MPKIVSKYHLQSFDLSGRLLSDELLPERDALTKFVDCVSLGVSLHFERSKDIRIVCGNHVLYQFRDVRSVVDQKYLKYV